MEILTGCRWASNARGSCRGAAPASVAGRVVFERDTHNPGLCASASPANGAMTLERKPNGGVEYTWT